MAWSPSYIWQVITGLFQIGITLGAFNVAKTRFEIVVIAFVILMYQHSREHLLGLGLGMMASISMLSDETKRIRELLKEETAEDAASRETEEKRELDNEIKRFQKVNAIRVIFGIIIWSITVFNLIFNGFL